VTVYTIGHGTREIGEFIACLDSVGVRTLVDVRRFAGSRRNPQFGGAALAAALAAADVTYRHVPALGGRLRGEPGEERFPCIRVAAFRSYAARMGRPDWQEALAGALAEPVPCLMCAETPWWRCHRRLISELLVARGHDVVHLLSPAQRQPHSMWEEAEAREGRLYLCGELVA
jgi:uncharacterized protein (DUF488 family)